MTRESAALMLVSSESKSARAQRACSHSTLPLNSVRTTAYVTQYHSVRRIRMDHLISRPAATRSTGTRRRVAFE